MSRYVPRRRCTGTPRTRPSRSQRATSTMPNEPDRELLGAVELPEAVPEPFAAVGPLADELLAEDAVDDVAEHRPAPLVVGLAHSAVVGRDPENGRRSGRSGTAEAPPPREWRRRPRGGRSGRRRPPRCASRVIIIRMITRCQEVDDSTRIFLSAQADFDVRRDPVAGERPRRRRPARRRCRGARATVCSRASREAPAARSGVMRRRAGGSRGRSSARPRSPTPA